MAAINSALTRPATIDILINGNNSLVDSIKPIYEKHLSSVFANTVRLWYVQLADKSNAWNVFLSNIWKGDGPAFFIDGYARPRLAALDNLVRCLENAPEAWIASGLPSIGRNIQHERERQIREHGIHGNLFCISQPVMSILREMNFRLPLGLYRVDSTIGAAIKFSLDPANSDWDENRVAVEPTATWDCDIKRWWNYSDIKGKIKRVLRQAQGDLENRAVRHHLAVCRRPVTTLPASVYELVYQWVMDNPVEARMVFTNPLTRFAWHRLCTDRNEISKSACLPLLVTSSQQPD